MYTYMIALRCIQFSIPTQSIQVPVCELYVYILILCHFELKHRLCTVLCVKHIKTFARIYVKMIHFY